MNNLTTTMKQNAELLNTEYDSIMETIKLVKKNGGTPSKKLLNMAYNMKAKAVNILVKTIESEVG